MGTSKIINITKIKCEPTKVFDITVSKNHNFILNNGLVVHNCVPYQYLRSCIYETRFEMYRSNRLFDEFVDIERNLDTGKIDHSPNFHKDALDAVCGATYNASKNAEQFAFDYGETLDNITTMNTLTENSAKNQITLDFEEELKKTVANSQPSASMDFGMGPARPVGSLISQGILVFNK